MILSVFLRTSQSGYTFSKKVSRRKVNILDHKFCKMAPHTGSATAEQIEALLNFLDEHKDLARGRLRSVDGKIQAKRLWEELCNMLNAMGGCTKTIQQWQKVWFDKKHLAKKAAADSRRSASETGGGPSRTLPLTQWELKVLSIMGNGFGERQTGAGVPAFREPREPTPSISSQGSQPPSISQPLRLDLPEIVVEPDHEGQPRSQPPPVSQEPSTSRLSSESARPRRRPRPSSDVASRLLQLEEGRAERERTRNTELAGIRAALLELCGLVQQFLDNR